MDANGMHHNLDHANILVIAVRMKDTLHQKLAVHVVVEEKWICLIKRFIRKRYLA